MGDIDIAVVDSLKVLDPNRPTREGDMADRFGHVRYVTRDSAVADMAACLWIGTATLRL